MHHKLCCRLVYFLWHGGLCPKVYTLSPCGCSGCVWTKQYSFEGIHLHTSGIDKDHKLFSSAGPHCIVRRYGRVVDCVWPQVTHINLCLVPVGNQYTIDRDRGVGEGVCRESECDGEMCDSSSSVKLWGCPGEVSTETGVVDVVRLNWWGRDT